MADDNEDPERKPDESIEPRDAWERLPTESDRAWRAFVQYRDSEKRSLTEVSRSSNFECSVSNISRWCVQHRWRERTFAYDAARDEQDRLELARGRTAMRKRHLQVALLMQSIAARGLEELRAKAASGTPLNMTSDECKNMMAAGSKLERETLGAGRESRFTTINVIYGTKPDDDEEGSAVEDSLIEGHISDKKVN